MAHDVTQQRSDKNRNTLQTRYYPLPLYLFALEPLVAPVAYMHLFSSIPPNKSPPKSLGFVLLLRLRLCFAPCFALLLCSFACGKQVILLGDGAVGKTSLATRFCEAKRPGGRAGGGQMVRGFLRKEASSTAPERLPLVSPLAIFANFCLSPGLE